MSGVQGIRRPRQRIITALFGHMGLSIMKPLARKLFGTLGGIRHRMVELALTFLLLSAPLAGLAQSAVDQAESYLGTEYRIGPEDVLAISVWREEDLQGEVIVRPDGGVSFPLVGDLVAAGRTPRELQEEIARRVQRYIPEAVVTVTVNQVAGYRIFVIGKVQNPGQFVSGRYVDVLQALTFAGGLTPYARESKIIVIRRDGGELVVLPFDFSDVKAGEALEQNIALESGDVVVVP